MNLLEEWGHPAPSEVAAEVARRHAANLPIIDLVTANPQLHGFDFPPLLEQEIVSCAGEIAGVYRPDARGQLPAREVVARYHGGVSPDRVLITPGTSFGYWAAFRLLCGEGGEVLCPSPTYPLFDDLARLAGAGVRRYHLVRERERWGIDLDDLRFQITPRTRAIVVVSPHNPTGMVATAGELAAIGEIASARGLTIIFDEVFREFVHRESMAVHRPSEYAAPLTITLNGFSKMFSLPGWKAGWLVAEGDAARVEQFMDAADYLSDTFLPVSEIVQAAIPLVFQEAPGFPAQLAAMYRARMGELVGACKASGLNVQLPEGGVYLPIQLRSGAQGDEIALHLLREHGILTHAGTSYHFDDPHLVITATATPPWPLEQIATVVAQL
jgi:alanine-synthesizing transaminase